MPIITKQNIIDRMGSAMLELMFSKELIFVPHYGNTDFGIDYSAEIIDVENKSVSGITIDIQLKSHNSIIFNNAGEFTQYVKTSTANYWLGASTPVVMVLVDLSTRIIYGVDAKTTIRKNCTFEQLKHQKRIALKINQNNLFTMKTCGDSIVAFEKYTLLNKSATDSFVILNFMKYFNECSKNNSNAEVDRFTDFTEEVLALPRKYYIPFINDKELIELSESMSAMISEFVNKGKIDYTKYIEKNRVTINKVAYTYLTKLVDRICDEIDLDKTYVLENNLYKFRRLKKIIETNGAPFCNDKWKDVSINALNYEPH